MTGCEWLAFRRTKDIYMNLTVLIIGGAVIFLVVAALAGIIPAVRASRIPPAVAVQSG